MKVKQILTVLMLLALSFANAPFVFSQSSPGEGWVGLGDYLKDTYKYTSGNNWTGEIYISNPDDDSGYRFATKLAYKKKVGEFLPHANLHLCRFEWDGENPMIHNEDEILISTGFDVTEKGNKIKKKSLPTEGDWTIFDLNGVALILKVTGINNADGLNSAILKNVYVYLDPAQDPMVKLNKIIAEREQAAREAFISSIYQTPDIAGWKPERVDKLDDGTVVERYKEGIRFIKKPNGDYASFLEPEDKIDENLNMVKGCDQPINKYAETFGNYRKTLKNGATVERTLNKYRITSPKGNYVEIVTSLDYLKEWEKEYVQKKNDLAYFDRFIYKLNYDNFLDDININSLEEEYVTSGSLLSNSTTTIYNADGTVINPVEGQNYALWSGYEPWGAGHINGPYTVAEKNGDKIIFTNGDFLEGKNGETAAHITLTDGSVVEKFPTDRRFKITHPNGDIFIGDSYLSLNQNNHYWDFVNSYYEDGKYHYVDGLLTKANGKEFNYKNGVNKEEQEAMVEKASKELLNQLYAKYGKANVDAFLNGNIKTGMKLQMLLDLGATIYRDDQIGNNTWYKWVTDITYQGNVQYRWLRVNNSTGVINLISNKKTVYL